MTTNSRFPYFDLLLDARMSGDPAFRVFERHVHWGYWPSPGSAAGTSEDLVEAMQRLDDEILTAADLRDIATAVSSIAVQGDRYPPHLLALVGR